MTVTPIVIGALEMTLRWTFYQKIKLNILIVDIAVQNTWLYLKSVKLIEIDIQILIYKSTTRETVGFSVELGIIITLKLVSRKMRRIQINM